MQSNAPSVQAPILELTGVEKAFGAAIALRSGQLKLHRGSILGLVGENGAGKSTLVKIIGGLYRPDAGRFFLDGQDVDFASTIQSRAAGIAVIYQEPTLFPDLSVTENIFIGRQPVGRFGMVDRKAMRAMARQLFDKLGVKISLDRLARGLSIADQQVIEIAKAIAFDARVLVMDEPTAALSGVEVERLFSIVRGLRDQGVAVLFISHRFDEVFSLCDSITVMRDGEYISTDAIADVNADTIVRRMVGRSITGLYPDLGGTQADALLEVKALTAGGVFNDISFVVRAGEIVCLAGLVGAGRSEVARAIFGVDGYDSGTVMVDGVGVPKGSPTASMRMGIALVPEDRRSQGLVMGASLARNVTLPIRARLARFGILTSRPEDDVARRWAARLRVKETPLDTEALMLSGGNQQKVVLGKWLSTKPRVLIIDEPTRGIDVGTKTEVHKLIAELAEQQVAILMISSELPEVIGMAHRIVVMREGAITEEIDRADATPERIMFAATHPRVALPWLQ